jgi:hypothetical protein
MVEDKMGYGYLVEESKEKWEKKSPQEKAAWDSMFKRGVDYWCLMWEVVKRIEKEFNINVMGILSDEIWKHFFEAGQRIAKKYEEHGLKEIYDAYTGKFEGLVNADWLEFNDKVLHKWNRSCPSVQHFRNLGKTDEEIKEIAPYYCLQEIGTINGFNPRFEVFPRTRLLLLGDSHCTYRIEDHGGK